MSDPGRRRYCAPHRNQTCHLYRNILRPNSLHWTFSLNQTHSAQPNRPLSPSLLLHSPSPTLSPRGYLLLRRCHSRSTSPQNSLAAPHCLVQSRMAANRTKGSPAFWVPDEAGLVRCPQPSPQSPRSPRSPRTVRSPRARNFGSTELFAAAVPPLPSSAEEPETNHSNASCAPAAPYYMQGAAAEPSEMH